MTMKSIAALGVAASLILAACGGPVDDDKASDFVAKASVANLFEIETSRLALERARTPEVRAFAQQMITDHTSAGEELKSALTEANSKLATATALDEKHQKLYTDLNEVPADDFDDKYVDIQTTAHDEALALFKDYSDGGPDGPVKRFAQNTLPTLEAHKDHIKSVDDVTHDGETHSDTASEATSPMAVQ